MTTFEVFRFDCDCGKKLETDESKKVTCLACGRWYEIVMPLRITLRPQGHYHATTFAQRLD
jgi:hypothetical protein